MVDTGDLKSLGRMPVPVRVWPGAPLSKRARDRSDVNTTLGCLVPVWKRMVSVRNIEKNLSFRHIRKGEGGSKYNV